MQYALTKCTDLDDKEVAHLVSVAQTWTIHPKLKAESWKVAALDGIGRGRTLKAATFALISLGQDNKERVAKDEEKGE